MGCKSTHIRKNGNKKGKQNHICVQCGRQFLNQYEPQRGYSEAIKRDCLKMYVNGMGLRAIERVKGVHHTERNKLGKTSRKTVARCL